MHAFDGTTALVTGAGSGIGAEVARALAHAGMRVALCGRRLDPIAANALALRTEGLSAEAFAMDATVWESVDSITRQVEAELGAIDVLVNCAGQHAVIDLPWKADPGAWWSEVEGNLKTAFLVSRAVLEGMVARGHGRIVNISSGAALEGRELSSAYATAKTGLLRLTESMEQATAPHGVHVFAVHPGLVRTALTEGILASEEGSAAYAGWHEMDWSPAELVAGVVLRIAAGELDAMAGRHIDATRDVDGQRDQVLANPMVGLFQLRLETEPGL